VSDTPVNRTAAGTPALAYADHGGTAREAVVLLHSLGTDRRLWEDTAAPLAAGRRVLVPDSRGHGASRWSGGPLTVGDWTADLDRVLDDAGVDSAALVGVSMGGVQAMAYAVARPERVSAVVVADTFAELDPGVARAKTAALAGRARTEGMRALADHYVATTFTVDPLPAAAEAVRSAIASMPVEAYEASAAACFGVRLAGDLADVKAPALVLWGERDEKAPRELSERIAAGIPGAALQVVPGAGHLANAENPEAFTASVTAFLTEHLSGK
jgi:3-oxoadipate enol-lactonase